MTRRQLPRYFIPRSGARGAGEAAPAAAPPAHVVDSFFVGHRHLEEREWAAAVDCFGNLSALPCEDRELFSAALRNELAFHEISGDRTARLLEVTEVFLFNLQLVEQPAGTPGWNDPVYLYGTLYGPYPEGAPAEAPGVEGQFTVTRGDLLDGLVAGWAHAFRHAGAGGADDQVSRCFHLLLPGGAEEEIRRGEGLVLAYPLLPAELLGDDVSNEIIIRQLIYDLLGALKEDLARDEPNHPLCSLALPVPSRHVLETQLRARGYSVEGDTAVKKVDKGEGFRGLLASVFGSLMGDRLELPPEGTAEDFLALARSALQSLPGWPSARNLALRDRVKPAPASRGARRAAAVPTTPVIRTPRATTQPPVTDAQAGRARPPRQINQAAGQPPAWMRDFIAAHRRADAPPPRLTSTTALKQDEPDWMKDFAPAAKPQPQNTSDKKKGRVKKPDWMEDFE